MSDVWTRNLATVGAARVVLCAVSAICAPGASALGQATDPPGLLLPHCGTPDREVREMLYGMVFDPSDCSQASTDPTPEYDPGALYEIPVVVHILMDDACTQGVISDEMVHSQIEILNEDFLALPGTNGENGTDAQVRFVLATEDPDGKPTTGITRDCNTTWYNDDGAYYDNLAWDPHDYLNLYTNTASGARGYVPFLPADGGGSQVGQPHDRVVVNWLAFGRNGPFPPHDQGRTATHEIGHYLGLLHTFNPSGQCVDADPPGCYTTGDLICDTEVEESSRDDCPKGAASCGSPDPITNYMDYTDDLCMQQFTLEQSRRVRCTLQEYRPELYNAVGQSVPELAFSPASLDFGNIDVGSSSPSMSATLHNTGDVAATALIFLPLGGDFVADTGACGPELAAGDDCPVHVTFTPTQPGPTSAALQAESAEGAAAILDLAGNGTSETKIFEAVALAVDPQPQGNGVFEPGESIDVAPVWRNDGTLPQSLSGTASDLTGPEGANYTLVLDGADYGTVEPGQTASCLDTGVCYQMGVDLPVTRPATHWEAIFEETLSDDTTKTWSLHVGDSFLDVPRTSPFYPHIETLLHSGVTGGCSDSTYCPTAPNTRAQMAVFVLKALEGPGYVPPTCVAGEEVFDDVPETNGLCPWIEDLHDRGVVAGCTTATYCPNAPVNRAQMAVFLLKTFEGGGYTPPACTGVFADVPCPSTFAAWIEELAAREITSGCSTEPLAYCPAATVNRQQMAVFVSKTFGLTLYGP